MAGDPITIIWPTNLWDAHHVRIVNIPYFDFGFCFYISSGADRKLFVLFVSAFLSTR